MKSKSISKRRPAIAQGDTPCSDVEPGLRPTGIVIPMRSSSFGLKAPSRAQWVPRFLAAVALGIARRPGLGGFLGDGADLVHQPVGREHPGRGAA